ncbi:MAG: 1-(5-phosphoribosyl)-5-[(5-phosphoribosylamino)methylideneamino]imidazole-4-carboxamide isomerase [Myxococcales bacterium]|nr:1-(5-phosphoribosyl)-5-[(5-phosphoribosylamino)methylideneamino]imidazole-4-carboxamide isomerase [Myxococcales bacterium]
MIVIPAIDLRGGQAVRLAEGDPGRMTSYSDAPFDLVDRFADAGARRLHVVDLDGAFAGDAAQLPLITAMIERAHARGLEVEVGGGIRSEAAIDAAIDAGADFVIVGTLAIREPALVAALCRRLPGRLIVAIDARDGVVATDGWTASSGVAAGSLAREAAAWGAGALLYTDIARDGLQGGPNVAATAALQGEVPIPVIASGGVGSLADLEALRDAGVQAVVLGRALYEGSVDLKEAIARC